MTHKILSANAINYTPDREQAIIGLGYRLQGVYYESGSNSWAVVYPEHVLLETIQTTGKSPDNPEFNGKIPSGLQDVLAQEIPTGAFVALGGVDRHACIPETYKPFKIYKRVD